MSDFDRALANARARRGLAPHGSSAQPDTRALIIGGGPNQAFTALQQTEETQARTGGDQKTSWVNVAPDPVEGITRVLIFYPKPGEISMIYEFWYKAGDDFSLPPPQRTRPAHPKPIYTPVYPNLQWGQQLHARLGGANTHESGTLPTVTIQGTTISTVELLGSNGVTLKSCSQKFVYSYTSKSDGMGGSETASEHELRAAQVFDTDPPMGEFYGIRLKAISDVTPGYGAVSVQLDILDGQLNGI